MPRLPRTPSHVECQFDASRVARLFSTARCSSVKTRRTRIRQLPAVSANCILLTLRSQVLVLPKLVRLRSRKSNSRPISSSLPHAHPPHMSGQHIDPTLLSFTLKTCFRFLPDFQYPVHPSLAAIFFLPSASFTFLAQLARLRHMRTG